MSDLATLLQMKLRSASVVSAALVFVSAVLIGCGKSDREKAQAVAQEFATDLRTKQGEPCDLLSRSLSDGLGGDRCDARLRKMYAAEIGDGKVTVHRVYEDSSYARAEATVGDVQLMLNDSLDKWHIDTINP